MKLEDLKSAAEARTKGEWQWTHISRGLEAITICDVETGNHINITHSLLKRDAESITITNNHFDAFLKLLEASKEFEKAMYGGDWPADRFDDLKKAIAEVEGIE